MQPQNSNSQSNRPGSQYDFITQGNDPAPAPSPNNGRQKKIFIALGILVGLMLIVAVVAVATSGKQKPAPQTDYKEGVSTNVPLTEQDIPKFTMRYPSSLKVSVNEEIPQENGWFLAFAESDESSRYDVWVKVSDKKTEYVDTEEAVVELSPDDTTPINLVTTDVTIAGTQSKKTVGEYTSNGAPHVVAYSVATVGDRYVEVYAAYPKDMQDITDSFDAMIGTIKLK